MKGKEKIGEKEEVTVMKNEEARKEGMKQENRNEYRGAERGKI